MAWMPEPWAYTSRREKRAAQRSVIEKMADDIKTRIAADPSAIGIAQAKQVATETAAKYDPKPPANSFLKEAGRKAAASLAEAKRLRDEQGDPSGLEASTDASLSAPATPQRPRPGVPRGVAEAQPDTVQGGKVYDSGSHGPDIPVGGSLVDNRKDLPGIVQHALNTPVLGAAITEVARPANYVPIGPGGFLKQVGQNVFGNLGMRAAEYVTPEDAPGVVKVGAGLAGAVAGGGGFDGGVSLAERLIKSRGGSVTPEALQAAVQHGVPEAAGSILKRAGEAFQTTAPDFGKADVEAALGDAATGAGKAFSGALSGAGDTQMLDPLNPHSATQRLFNIREPKSVLGKTDEMLNSLHDAFEGIGNVNTRNEIGTPIAREHARVMRNVESQSARLGLVADDTIKVFERDEAGRITSLPGSPTIQDLAARYPQYVERLTPEQRTAMQKLRAEAEPFGDALRENGVDLNSRADVVDGGFYLPRGKAGPEGFDAPAKVRVAGRGASKIGAEKAAVFDSMAEGIDAGYEYTPFQESMQSYGMDAGRRALNRWTEDTFKATGLGESRVDRINPGFRAKIEALRRETASTRATLVNQNARASTIETGSNRAQAQAARTETLAMNAGARLRGLKARIEAIKNPAATAANEEGAPLPEGYDFQQLISSLPDRADLEAESKRLRDQLTRNASGDVLKNKANSALADKIGQTDALHEIHYALERANGDAGKALDFLYEEQQRVGMGLEARSQPGFRATLSNERPGASRRAKFGDAANATSLYNRATGATDDSFEVAKAYSKALDDLTGGAEGVKPGEVFSELDTPPVLGSMPTDEAVAAAQREFTVMDREARKQLKAAERTGNQAEAARIRNEITGQRYDDLRQQLKDALPAWKAMQEKAAQTPPDQQTLGGLSGLNGTSFPDAVANSWNKYYNSTQPLGGKGAGVPLAIKVVNNFLRGLHASADISYTGIQGLLGAASHPKEYAEAMKLSFQSLGDEGVLGAHLNQFDEAAKSAALPDSRAWAAGGLRIGGMDTEFQVGAGVGGKVGEAIRNAPGIKQSNRAFGYFGDTLRLEAAQAMAKAAKASGKEITPEYIAQAAHAANLITGWADKPLAGGAGELFLFAPRFFSSQLELVGAAFTKGGPVGDEARRSLVRLVGIGTLATFAANEARGKDTEFDPRKPNFMRIRDVGGTDISLFGPWDSLVKGIAASKDDPTYFLRTKASPTVALAWDLLSGHTFTGQATRDGMIPRPGYLLRNLLPFSAAQVGQESPLKTAIGLTGVKASDLSPTEQLDKAGLDSPAHKAFRDMTMEEKGALLDAHPDLAKNRTDAYQGKYAKYQDEKVKASTRRKALDDALLSGSMSREDWQKASGDINVGLRAVATSIFGEDRDPPDAAAQKRDPAMKWLAIQREFIDPKTKVVDQTAFQQALAERMTPDEIQAAYRGFGADDTPLQKLRSKYADEYYSIPKYRGMTADDGAALDQSWNAVLDKVGASASPSRKIRAISALNITDPQVRRALYRRAAGGTIGTDKGRERWAKAHPAAAPLLGLGRGSVSDVEKQALESALSGVS